MRDYAAIDSIMSTPRALRALLASSIDYAGLFPPATLELEPALKNFARYVRSDDAWMLSSFVLPLAKFADVAWLVSEFTEENPLQISALGPKTTNEIDFAEELKNVSKGIEQLTTISSIRIEQLEMPLPKEPGRAVLMRARGVPARSFWEAPADDAQNVIAFLAERRAGQQFGFKLRTGGVTADAFPASQQIARALVAAVKNNVPIKFTAGLHHPVRMFRDEVKTKMHGFLNVLGAGVLAIERGWNEEQVVAMLDDEDASAFKFTDEAFSWRDHEVATAKISEHRKLITSFGSCSFDEPREDLRALNLL
jgi:hypothetical protein